VPKCQREHESTIRPACTSMSSLLAKQQLRKDEFAWGRTNTKLTENKSTCLSAMPWLTFTTSSIMYCTTICMHFVKLHLTDKLQNVSVPPAAPLGKVRWCLIIQSVIQPPPGCLAVLQQDELPTRLAHCGHLLQLQVSTLTMLGTHCYALQQHIEYIMSSFGTVRQHRSPEGMYLSATD